MRQEQMKRKIECKDIKSLHRDRKEIVTSKKKRGFQSSTWFLQGQISRTIRCDPTPGSKLCKSLKEVLNSQGTKERTLVLEEGESLPQHK